MANILKNSDISARRDYLFYESLFKQSLLLKNRSSITINTQQNISVAFLGYRQRTIEK